MPCSVDVLGRLFFSEGKWGVDLGERRGGGVGRREGKGNCDRDVMYERRVNIKNDFENEKR